MLERRSEEGRLAYLEGWRAGAVWCAAYAVSNGIPTDEVIDRFVGRITGPSAVDGEAKP